MPSWADLKFCPLQSLALVCLSPLLALAL